MFPVYHLSGTLCATNFKGVASDILPCRSIVKLYIVSTQPNVSKHYMCHFIHLRGFRVAALEEELEDHPPVIDVVIICTQRKQQTRYHQQDTILAWK